MTTSVVAYCRAGFEQEAADDLSHALADDASLAATAVTGAGYVVTASSRTAASVDRALAPGEPVFARTVFVGNGPVAVAPASTRSPSGPRADRVTPLQAAIDALAADPLHRPPWRDAWIEHPDTNEGKSLSTLARALSARIGGTLRDRQALDPRAPRRLHAFLVDGSTAWVGTSDAVHGSRWPLGIPRLHMPRGAPSRSTLKLAEAFVVFLGDEANDLLRPGMRAVDLGAAPGGWTWQLVQRGLRVTTVDNGALKGAVASDPFVTHVRADGLSWRPRKPVDWMVCDIVLAPSRIAELCARWIAEGAARRTIFNLKLPMKKRSEAVRDARTRIAALLDRAGVRHELRVRQLYHDREEVTAYLSRLD
jgi:23S rRNA (cytidine2498-2'-O)-methyltransferase